MIHIVIKQAHNKSNSGQIHVPACFYYVPVVLQQFQTNRPIAKQTTFSLTSNNCCMYNPASHKYE